MKAIATHRSRALVVGVVGLVLTAALVVNVIDAARPDSGDGRDPYVRLYAGDRNQIEALLVTGDGQAFAALAQDPSLARPEVIAEDGEFAYRAQRPVWGYLAWAGSLGQGGLAGWALAVLTILAAGLACAVTALLLLARGANPWWALVVLLAGYESIVTLTPELFAFALFGLGLVLWTRDRHALAVVALCGAALTRETMLVGVAALGVWQLAHAAGAMSDRLRRALPFAWPFAAVIAWDVVLRVRLGAWPTGGGSESRLAMPGVGLVESLAHDLSPGLLLGVLLAVVLVGFAVTRAPHDPLTWVSAAYAIFAVTFSEEVWTHAGFTRALLPMYVCSVVAVLGALRQASSQAAGATAGSISYTAAPSLTTNGS